MGCGGLRLPPLRTGTTNTRTRGERSSWESAASGRHPGEGQRDLGGEIVGVSFERKQDIWLYEFKVVEPGGRLVEVYVDAASGRVLKQEAD